MFLLSFPTRERGLKCAKSIPSPASTPSFPTRERGLKFETLADKYGALSRSPRGNVD